MSETTERSPTEVAFRQMMGRLPALTRQTIGAAVALSLLGGLLGRAAFALSLATTIGGMRVWTIFTAPFFHGGLVSLVVYCMSFAYLGTFVENRLPRVAMIQLFSFVTIASSVTTLVVSFLSFIFSFQVFFFQALYYGFGGWIGAALVVMKQLVPEQECSPISAVPVKAAQLPSAYIALQFILLIAGESQGFMFSILGVYFGWLYLRSLQPNEDGLVGDASELMAFGTLFPQPAQPAIDRIASRVEDLCWRGRIKRMLRRLFATETVEVADDEEEAFHTALPT